MSEPRIIKKYPNRRLYDTQRSCYITLGEVRQLVLEEVELRIVDAKSSEEITRTILLQIILEAEEGGEPILSTRTLERIIRFYGDSMQGMVSTYLERSLGLFVAQQEKVRQQMKEMIGADPFNLMREVTEQNLTLWKEMQEGFFQASTRSSAPKNKPKGSR